MSIFKNFGNWNKQSDEAIRSSVNEDQRDPFENVVERLPTEDEMSEISHKIADKVRGGDESGNGFLSTGEAYRWVLEGATVARDSFVRDYIANLIANGQSEGTDPNWNVVVAIPTADVVEENLNDVIFDIFSDGEDSAGDEDGLFDVFPEDDDVTTSAREEGIAAQQKGLLISDNPYDPLSDDYDAWEGGFRSSDDDMIEADSDEVEFDAVAPKLPR